MRFRKQHGRFPKQKGLLHSVQQPLSFIALFQLGVVRVGVGFQQSLFGVQQVLRGSPRSCAGPSADTAPYSPGLPTARPQMVTGTLPDFAASMTMVMSFFMAGLAGR